MATLHWTRSDQPTNSIHTERGRCGARVMPLPNGLYGWSTWIGAPGKRVLHQRGEVKLESSARREATRALLASDRCFTPSI